MVGRSFARNVSFWISVRIFCHTAQLFDDFVLELVSTHFWRQFSRTSHPSVVSLLRDLLGGQIVWRRSQITFHVSHLYRLIVIWVFLFILILILLTLTIWLMICHLDQRLPCLAIFDFWNFWSFRFRTGTSSLDRLLLVLHIFRIISSSFFALLFLITWLLLLLFLRLFFLLTFEHQIRQSISIWDHTQIINAVVKIKECFICVPLAILSDIFSH